MLHASPEFFALPLADDMMGSVQQFRRPLIALVVAFFLTASGCGSFFPGANDIASIQIAPQNASVAPGVQQQFTATATYGNNTTGDVTSSANTTWSTNPSSIATITNESGGSGGGLLTGNALGTATVEVKNGSATATTSVTVITKTVTSVTIAPLTQTLSASGGANGPQTVQFTATATYQDGSMGTVTNTSTWNSLPSSVASISSTGLATAVAVGTATVTATNAGVTSNAATITVVQ